MDQKQASKILERISELRDGLGGNLKEAQAALERLSTEVEQIENDMEDYDRETRNFRQRFNQIEKKLAKISPDEIMRRINKLESAVDQLPTAKELKHQLGRIRNDIESATTADPANVQGRVETLENMDIVTLTQLRMYVGMVGVLVMILGALDFFS